MEGSAAILLGEVEADNAEAAAVAAQQLGVHRRRRGQAAQRQNEQHSGDEIKNRGEIGVLLINHGGLPFPIRRGERIAQMVIAPVVRVELAPAAELSATKRGGGGFGSTGR